MPSWFRTARDASRAARASPVVRARPRVATPVPRRTFGVALRAERDQGGEPCGDDRQLVLHLPGRPLTIDLRFPAGQSVVEKVEVGPGSTGTTGSAVGSGERLHREKRVRAVRHSDEPLFQRLRQLGDVLAVGDRRTIRRGVQVRMAWRRWLLCAGDTGCGNREGQDRQKRAPCDVARSVRCPSRHSRSSCRALLGIGVFETASPSGRPMRRDGGTTDGRLEDGFVLARSTDKAPASLARISHRTWVSGRSRREIGGHEAVF